MDVAVILANQGTTGFLHHVSLAERLGFSAVGVGDTPLNAETFVSLAAAASITDRVSIGPLVTSLAARSETTVAAATATLDDLSGGRAFLGLGSGDSSARHVGVKPAGTSELTVAIPRLRSLMAGEPTCMGGHDTQQWGRTRVPIVLAANGPATRAVGAEVADAVLLGSGLSQDVLLPCIAEVREAAKNAGRAPGEPQIWVMARTSVADDAEAAGLNILPIVSVSANHTFASPRERQGLPEHLRSAAASYVQDYDYSVHGRATTETGARNPNVVRLEATGLSTYVLDRFSVIGDPQQVAKRYQELALMGVSRVVAPVVAGDVEASLQLLAESVLHGSTIEFPRPARNRHTSPVSDYSD